MHMQTPLLMAALAGQTHWAIFEDPGGEMLYFGHWTSTPPWQK
jgi:hypothetical protein